MEVSEHFNYPQMAKIRLIFFPKCKAIKSITTMCPEMIYLYAVVYK